MEHKKLGLLLTKSPLLGLLVLPATTTAQDLLVSNPSTDSIKRFDWLSGTYVGDFVAPGAGGLDYPTAIAYGPDGNLYVGSGPNSEVLRFDGVTGEYIDRFVDDTHFRGGPSDMCFRQGLLYVSQWNNEAPFNGGVLVFDGHTGEFVKELVDDVSRSNAIGFDLAGMLYVSEFAANRVHVYDGSGVRVRSIGGSSTLSGAMDIAFDASGNLLVGSWFQGSVRRFDASTGELLDVLVGGLANTGSLGIAPDGTLMVDDHGLDRIARHDTDSGAFLGYAASGGGLGAQEKFTFMPDPGVCIADIDGDGSLSVFDFLAFQNLFDAGDARADLDGDGALTIFDFLAFQDAFDAGC